MGQLTCKTTDLVCKTQTQVVLLCTKTFKRLVQQSCSGSLHLMLTAEPPTRHATQITNKRYSHINTHIGHAKDKSNKKNEQDEHGRFSQGANPIASITTRINIG